MHAERWGKTCWSTFPSLRIKKQKLLCAANVPAIIFKVHYLLFHLSYSWTCLIVIDISKVRQQYKQLHCCLTSPFKTHALLHDLSCCLGILSRHFQSGWLVREREWRFSLGSYHAIHVQVVPPRRGWRDTVHRAAPSSQMLCFPGYSMGCRNTVLVYGWIKSHFSHATVTVLWSCFSSGCLHRPAFFHVNT